MARVLISDKLSPAAVQIFENRGIDVTYEPSIGKDNDRLRETIGPFDGIAIRSASKLTTAVIAAGSNLKVIGRAGIGVDNIDIAAATAAGVVVMNTPFGNAITTAEHAVAMMFAAARQIPQASASTHLGKWEKAKFMGVELYAKTLGLIGCGNIGSIVASRALGLQMKVASYDPYLTPERAAALGIERVDLDELLARADIITLHTPLTEQTRNILSRENLEKTKQGVIVINCARGGLVDEAALKDGLDSGHIQAAALDVFATEPATEHPLFGHDRVICTPHLGASTREAQENVAIQVAEQMSDYLLNGAVANSLNMPSINAEDAPRLRPYLRLAEQLGSFAGQLVDSGIQEIEVVLAGRITDLKVKPVFSTAVAGVLKSILSGVNVVSAPAVAHDHSISVTESTKPKAVDFDSTLTIQVRTEDGVLSLTGALFGGAPRIIGIDGIAMEASFASSMLYVANEDKPGLIGALGGLLGAEGVNIATFNLGRNEQGAIALVAVDGELSNALLDKVRSLPHVVDAKSLQF